jgi:hypothetical protein
MKNITLYLLFLIPFSILAQDDDYCPCQETKDEYEDIFSFISSASTNDVIFIVDKTNSTFEPISIQKEEPVMIVFNQKEIPEPEPELIKIEEEKSTPKLDSNNGVKRSKIKRSKKLFKTKIKRQQRAKKYKGKCPIF